MARSATSTPRSRLPFRGADVDHVTCVLCAKEFRAVSFSHLVQVHEFNPEHPIEEYKRRFRVRHESRATVRKRTRIVHEYLEKVGRRWTKARVRRMITDWRKRGLPLNHAAATRRCSSLPAVATKLYGSWELALEACGVRYENVRRRRVWTRTNLLATIRRDHQVGAKLNVCSVQDRDPGLLDAARSRFGTWDAALRAAGLDPAKIRKTRRWDRQRVRAAIRALGPLVPYRDQAALESGLVSAATRYFGSWRRALAAAGSRPAWPRPAKWTPQRISAFIRDRAARGRSLRYLDIHRTAHGALAAAAREFGSWRAAVEAAGAPYLEDRRTHPIK